jgi:immunity protein, SdpI family
MKARDFAAPIVLVLAVAAGILLVYSDLPARIPIHWNARGEVDGYGARWVLFPLGPGLMAAELLVFAVLPALSPKRFDVDAFRSTYVRIMLVAVAFPAYIVAIVAGAALTGRLDVTGAILGGVSVLLIVIGNVMGKVRRNFFIGIRTPWTLASERVWYATHRLAAKSIVATSIASLGAALWGGLAGTIVWLALVLAGVTIPVVYSFVHYRALERTGGLEPS